MRGCSVWFVWWCLPFANVVCWSCPVSLRRRMHGWMDGWMAAMRVSEDPGCASFAMPRPGSRWGLR
eukprot:12523338-Prorocentrum_lima.AAC.1